MAARYKRPGKMKVLMERATDIWRWLPELIALFKRAFTICLFNLLLYIHSENIFNLFTKRRKRQKMIRINFQRCFTRFRRISAEVHEHRDLNFWVKSILISQNEPCTNSINFEVRPILTEQINQLKRHI